ncbi:MAG: C-GCAxxG-C-C family protein [Clostridia bacterium]|nr:C-GCAxxG-C-C family protein [Clostridia bacterium]
MLADVAERYFLQGDFNCAESVLLAANEVYELGLDKDACHRLVSAFGGGMGCGLLCGAIAGAMAALGQAAVAERAHVTAGFKDLCADTAAKMEEALGSVNCSVIKPALFVEGRRCAETVRRAADVLEKQMAQLRA